jgi:hypothetical protein
MIKVIRAYDITSRKHTFSVVATDKGYTYVFSDDKNPMFDAKKRQAMIMERIDADPKKLKVDDYLGISTLGLSNFYFSNAFDEPNEKIAVKTEKIALARADMANNGRAKGAAMAIAADDIDQVFHDFPELFDQLSSDDPDQEITASGMIELVFAALGGVDPNGPNAWLLDYMDGQTAEGYVGDLVFDPELTNKETGKE